MDPARSTVVAAVILGAAIVGGSLLLKSSLDRGTREIRTSLAEVKTALEAAPRAGGQRAAAQPARRGPDPNRRHTVDVAGAPARGPVDARVKLVEFSDFQ